MRQMMLPLLLIFPLGLYAQSDGEAGAQLLSPFKKELKDALMQGLKQGPEQAIEVCRLRAPAIAQKYSTNGVLMGRTSDRLRNPNNRSPAWVEPILAQYQRGDLDPVSVSLTPKRQGYAEPITMAPPCLVCHGEQIGHETRALLKHYYPEDMATGYQLGQWRGLFWVEYPIE